ncbi:phosphotransferase [Subtercola endophyticus]|uniref:phosphotransferase n=1 Tax=Subtercola endophyticus TaxID=2895559 RepID=UPI001E5CFD8D|nr:phosphotransferase [Subtercola endophyticus]UFS58606.1 phosphotransferase [Subtercola endophyticus]
MSASVELTPEIAAERLEEAMARFVGTVDWHAETLAAGLTNRSWIVRIEGADPVVAQSLMDADGARSIGIDRERQYAAADLAASLGIAPRMLVRYLDLGVVISEFVVGTTFFDATELRPRAIVDIARSLRTLHAVEPDPRFENDITVPMSGTRLIRERARSANPQMFAEFSWAIDPIETVEELYRGRDLCLLHNDLTDGNILVGPVTRLVDWEYCGLGDPYSDLGDFAGKCELSVDEELVLIEHYQGEYDWQVHAWLRLYRYINVVREALWGIRMTEIGKSESDYDAYARFRFAQVGDYIGGAEFSWAVESLRAGLDLAAESPSSPRQK